ncbi:MAG: thioredoxin-dependent thiol peroxidase [Candidatus Omnitrophica bacterium]|nr:thioredoxin-dependent thiol peroxidase [Candidatus Omnitrophota bacterium]
MAVPQEGKAAPAFTLPANNGKKVSLKDFKEKQQVVLYFYPKDNTPGCTKEACSFKDNIKKLEGKDAIVLGVSRDSVDSHIKFVEKFGLPFLLLSDEKEEICKKYDVIKEKNMYGKKVIGIERSTFVIGKDGKIKKIFRKVKVDGHTDQVLAALDE